MRTDWQSRTVRIHFGEALGERMRRTKLDRIVRAACSRWPITAAGSFDDRIGERVSMFGPYVYCEDDEARLDVDNTLRMRRGLEPLGPGPR